MSTAADVWAEVGRRLLLRLALLSLGSFALGVLVGWLL